MMKFVKKKNDLEKLTADFQIVKSAYKVEVITNYA